MPRRDRSHAMEWTFLEISSPMTGKFASAEAWMASCSSGLVCKSMPSRVTRTSMSGNRDRKP